MQNLKIRVNGADESKEAQELFFKLGGSWGIGGRKIRDTDEPYLYLENGLVLHGYSAETFNAEQHKEITLPELRAMAEPKMKEYLIPDRNYEYILTDAREGLEPHAKDWIEIPEGSNYAYNNDLGLLFMPSEIGFNHPLLVWQREQDEPFLTPETTLNDQYAEIEKVRQVEIHGTLKAKPDFNFGATEASGDAKEKSSKPPSAWGTQVGGVHYKQFKIQPMQFALENKLDAAQQNVIKYIMRHSFKNGKQDLEKAKHYIDLMIEFYYGENNNG